MKTLFRYSFLSILLAASACKSVEPSSSDPKSLRRPGVPLPASLNEGQREYLQANKSSLEWFRDTPVGNSGIPLLMFKLFPDVFPDIWGDDWLEQIGLFPHEDDKHILPYGLGWDMGSRAIVNLPGLRNIRMQIVNFSCASCHTGRVIDDEGKVQMMLGAPNTKMDLGLWRSKLNQTVNDPRFTDANFRAALASKRVGWLYKNPLLLAQEAFDTEVFKKEGPEIVAGIKANVNKTYNGIHQFLGIMGYDAQTSPFLDSGALGQLEGGFGSAVSKLVPEDFAQIPEAARREKLKVYFPNQRMVVDIMSVWRQEDRFYAQWDGNIQPKIPRNLGAELGVIPDPKLVSYENSKISTAFIAKLPAPSYPFPIDGTRAMQGKEIFDRACLACHGSKTIIVPLAQIGTDPGRSPGITPLSRDLISKMILEACTDKSNPECTLPPSNIIKDMGPQGGYVAGPLDGIWARAPYLHNGSVPTLAQILMPKQRAAKFVRGNIHYDQKEVGFEWQKKEPFTQLYDTSLSGYSNLGHSDGKLFNGGIDFETDVAKRMALLEYLKTL